MAVPGREVDLSTLARHLAEHGPHKTLPTERRVRILINGACIADTLGTAGALFVWEHPYYPQLYFPKDALVKNVQGYGIIYEDHQDVKDSNNNTIATTLKVKVQRKSDNNMKEVKDGFVVFSKDLSGKANPLSNMLKVNFSAAGKCSYLYSRSLHSPDGHLSDQWLEEDTPIFVHPKDPFKRIDILHSSRSLRVSIKGTVIAESPTCMQLYESGLPVRYYIPLTSISTAVLRASKTTTQCPYKGEAEYYDVVIDGETHKDIVWFYTRPTLECGTIAGLCCFYNEKVDLELKNGDSWEKLGRMKTIFS
ncbi:unnamed protein product [Aureobasidium uvarum]|uniref:DUF427 domain-containing protein n=1 Tax=Aureobasidium uvarum TaxID=2773716 RepID=A0A9N8K6K1_9PEZI|nr:unnamed protein product [Aureobasidium uvarum]